MLGNIVVAPAAAYLVIQVFGHPNLFANSHYLVTLPITAIDYRIVTGKVRIQASLFRDTPIPFIIHHTFPARFGTIIHVCRLHNPVNDLANICSIAYGTFGIALKIGGDSPLDHIRAIIAHVVHIILAPMIFSNMFICTDKQANSRGRIGLRNMRPSTQNFVILVFCMGDGPFCNSAITARGECTRIDSHIVRNFPNAVFAYIPIFIKITRILGIVFFDSRGTTS